MTNSKKILVLILLMIIGFASISTVLLINGSANLSGNLDDFAGEVYFSKAETNDGESVISQDQKTITFTSRDLSKINETAILNYEVTNNSKNYDADVKISCLLNEESSNDYIELTNTPNSMIIEAGMVENGSITARVKKSYFEEAGLELGFSCTLNANALERDNVASKKEVTISLNNNDEIETLSVQYGRPLSFIAIPEKNGYEFDHFEDENGNVLSEDMIVTEEMNIKLIYESTTLYDLIKSLSVGSSSELDFNKSSQANNENGVYQLSEDNKVYFYRGQVDNNIIFNNICWKIIRTTSTEGVKLIYNGIPVSGKCTTQIGDDTTIGKVKYNSQDNNKTYADYKISEIKGTVESWYATNMATVDSKIEDTPYCSDMSEVAYNDSNLEGTTSSMIMFAASKRASYYTKNVQPSLQCNATYAYTKAKGNLAEKVGLITLDEQALAGATSFYNTDGSAKASEDFSNNTYYLYNTSHYWTMSPVRFNSSYASVGNVRNPRLYYYNVGVSSGVRPVVSLAPGTRVTPEGTGTVDNPYEVIVD